MVFEKETKEIIGALFAVHSELGCGFLEAVYQEALAIEFKLRNIPFEQEKKLTITYKNIPLTKFYIADFVCYNKIIIETKALSALTSEHEAQLLNYLKATELKLGLLVNFGERSLKFKRMIS
ncbi:GxxExxY protein [Paludibacter jiangxiensis]|uniref:GxxExxY protein n=1 Tax=Paludibacter jiangxiensis TaxID=681398 RepID=A0A161LUU6_9BACT|nr:GxxExxY protein [Paludibacter jiangxiensis]GAT62859.1 GxxExxY protein [Paludibacter jiangxiensis]